MVISIRLFSIIQLELQTPETMKKKKSIDKTKKIGENVPSLEAVEKVLVQCNLVNKRYQQKSI